MKAILLAYLLEMLASISDASRIIVGPCGGQRICRGAAVSRRARPNNTWSSSTVQQHNVQFSNLLMCMNNVPVPAHISCIAQGLVQQLQECVVSICCKSCNSHARAIQQLQQGPQICWGHTAQRHLKGLRSAQVKRALCL